jgi:hypothetical protein
MSDSRNSGLIGAAATGLGVAANAGDTARVARKGKSLLRHLSVPAAYRKPLQLGAKVGAPIGTMAATAAKVAGTDTQDYYTRFGMSPPQNVSPLAQMGADIGVRTLGAASELIPSFLDQFDVIPGAGHPGDALRQKLFRDAQLPKRPVR